MTPHASPAGSFDSGFAASLSQSKADVVDLDHSDPLLAQHGLALLTSDDRPAWPSGLTHDEAVIETYLVGDRGVSALSDNQPFVGAWLPHVTWLHAAVAKALDAFDLAIDGDGYVTASLTPTAELEGLAHLDDDTFTPTENVGVVAIIGELAGPRVATKPIASPGLRAMSQVQFSQATLDAFAAGDLAHHQCPADQIAIFPQFGQLHAGPAAEHVAHLAPLRQLLVLRARVVAT